jgi:hypothetical protein
MSSREDSRATNAFLSPSWADRRFGTRVDMVVPAMLRERGGRARAVHLANISTAGCRAEGVFLRPQERVWIRIGNLAPLEATVTWAEGEGFGLAFHQPLHWGVFEWLAREAGSLTAPPS